MRGPGIGVCSLNVFYGSSYGAGLPAWRLLRSRAHVAASARHGQRRLALLITLYLAQQCVPSAAAQCGVAAHPVFAGFSGRAAGREAQSFVTARTPIRASILNSARS